MISPQELLNWNVICLGSLQQGAESRTREQRGWERFVGLKKEQKKREKSPAGTGARLCGGVPLNEGIKALYNMKLVIILKSMR